MNIAFIGMGIMGRPMAVNLKQAGHVVFVHGRRRETMAAPVAAGCTGCASPAEAAAKAEVVIVMMGTGHGEFDSAAMMKIVERESGMER